MPKSARLTARTWLLAGLLLAGAGKISLSAFWAGSRLTGRCMALKYPKPKRASKRKTRIDKNGHEFLYGVKEHLLRRIELFGRAGGIVTVYGIPTDATFSYEATGSAACEQCGMRVWWDGPGGGHWIHLERRHCDCLTCCIFGCKSCHTKLHHGGRSFL